MMQDGSGDMLADAIYGVIKDCNATRDSGRRTTIDIKPNAASKVFNVRA